MSNARPEHSSRLTIDRILCPVDFSDASEHAIEHAVAIARWSGAAVSALHVCHPMFVSVPSFIAAGASSPDADMIRLRAATAAFVDVAGTSGLNVDIHVEAGDPARQILERAQMLGASLIVMGTHGATGFARLILGSVTEKVLRKASCPVLTVPPRAYSRAALPYTRLLCAIDFSPASLDALDYAVALAERSQSTLDVLHVIQWPWDEPPAPAPQDLPAEQAIALTEYRRYVETIAMARLAALRRERMPAGTDFVPRLAHGKPYVQILRVAGDTRTDLIVLGVHGRNVADMLAFGSTANQVVRAATCPVLTVRQ
jgi:nucleotide-binding universal stress UspA family protein